MYCVKLIHISIFITVVIEQSHEERTKDRMYINIEGSSACFRRLDATHQIGCSSERGGTNGVIHFCESVEDVEFILNNGSAGPYIPVLPTDIFTQTFDLVKNSPKISGLVLFTANSTLSTFSHDRQCPNDAFGVEDTCDVGKGTVWNPDGTGIMFREVSFPIFLIEKNVYIEDIIRCFRKFNNFSYENQRDRSLCSLQLSSFMYATTDTPTCIRRSSSVINLTPLKFCDPLGDQNVWASLIRPLVSGSEYIIIAARLDTSSLFDKTAGADSPVTGLVTLLTTAKLLKAILPSAGQIGSKNVLFVLFNGETYDYIGSQRLLYEMEEGNFPGYIDKSGNKISIRPGNIGLFIELSQLSQTGSIFVHRYFVDERVKAFSKVLKNSTKSVTLKMSDGTLPPSSLQTFLKKYPNMSSVLLTNHERSYANHFYNSIYDDAANIKFTYYNTSIEPIPKDSFQYYTADLVNMVAKSVYVELFGKEYDGEETADVKFINELFHCYLEDPNCKVNQAVYKAKHQKNPLSLYVGVEQNTNYVTTLTGLILGWITGDVVGKADKDCTSDPDVDYKMYNMSKNIDNLDDLLCFKIYMNFSEAVSPAFIIPNYDWSSNLYSSWSESTWGEINMKIFLKPSRAHENMTVAIGCIIFIFSLILVYFINSRSDILFNSGTVVDGPTDC